MQTINNQISFHDLWEEAFAYLMKSLKTFDIDLDSLSKTNIMKMRRQYLDLYLISRKYEYENVLYIKASCLATTFIKNKVFKPFDKEKGLKIAICIIENVINVNIETDNKDIEDNLSKLYRKKYLTKYDIKKLAQIIFIKTSLPNVLANSKILSKTKTSRGKLL